MFRLLILLLTASPFAAAQTFEPAPLAYELNALEPLLDAETLGIHHGRHHSAYALRLNEEVRKDPRLQGMTLEQILRGVSQYSESVRNHAGAHFNHDFLWQTLVEPGSGGAPSEDLAAALAAEFGSVEGFQRRFESEALAVFGSGWAWLVRTDSGALAIVTTANQDNPLMDIVDPGGAPLLGLDLWEHAYYLKHRNVRADYVRGWWPLLNWGEVNRRFAESGGVVPALASASEAD